MPPKKTNSSAATPVIIIDGTPQEDASIANGEGSIPTGSSGPVGTNSTIPPESATSGEAGDPASLSQDGVTFDLAAALLATGCTDFENLVDMAKVGIALMNAIATHTVLEGPLKDWSPAENPAEVVGDLVAEIELLQEQVANREKQFADTGSDAEIVSSKVAIATPLTEALFASFEGGLSGDRPSLFRISAKTEGYWRGGVCHSADPIDHAFSDLTPEQLEEMLADPAMSVELV
ncbi:hypothetical protein [Pararhizobium sp.]|uniref:hypothetical protein n=1 Tax=Pararhizobium sp. TaxID=1977563 RepID=UPI003D0CAE0E